MVKKDVSSSGATANVKDWNEISKLGDRISAELKGDANEDWLKHWMAHRVAELLAEERAVTNPLRKEKLREECCNLILRIWRLRKRFDPNDPIQEINRSLHQLLFSQRPPFDSEKIDEYEAKIAGNSIEPDKLSFLSKLEFRFMSALVEVEYLRAAFLSTLPAEKPAEENEGGEGDQIDSSTYKRLSELKTNLITSAKSIHLRAILASKDEASLKLAVGKALETIDRERVAL